MAVRAGTAYVDIQGDFSGLNKQVSSHFRKIGKQAGGTGKKIGRTFGLGMAAGIGATAIAGKQLFDFGKDAVAIASDVSESLSKNRVLFGKYAGDIEKFSKRSADAFGISRRSALEYTGTFGNLFNALGISNKESAKFSTNLIKLAADMASFNNSTPEEALDAIRAALVGETEPIRKFGVNMNDATLRTQALRMGLIKTTKEALTPQTKALAAQALITKQTAAAHGDFAKTSDGLANSQRRLKARWEDMKGTLGDALLPAVTNVGGALLDIADKVQPKVERAVRNIIRIFGSDDLSFGEKLQRSWDAVKLEFGPMVADLVQGFKNLNLDDKLAAAVKTATPKITAVFKDVGIAAAKAVWEGFQAAPLWAKVGGGLWLMRKLGISSAMFKGLTSLVSGRGGAAGAGGLAMPGATPARPMYVIVQNWKRIAAGSAAGGALGTSAAAGAAAGTAARVAPGRNNAADIMARNAAPAAGAAAATGFLAKFKGQITKLGPKLLKGAGIGAGIAIAGDLGSGLVGEVVGGKTGENIKKIGSRAAMWGGIGATAGTLIAPGIGTAIGGAGGAIVGGLTAALSKEKPTLEQAGTKLLKDMLPPDIFQRVSGDLVGRVGKLQEDIRKRTEAIAARDRPQIVGGGRFATVAKESKEQALKELALTDADKAQIAKDYEELGKLSGSAYVAGVETHHEFFGAGELTKGFTEQLKKTAPQARQAALNAMVDFARTMEQQGRLPKGASERIVANIKQRFNLLPSGITSAAKKGMDSLSAQLRRRDAVEAAEKQRQDLARTWGDLPRMARTTGRNAVNNFKTEIDFLKDKVRNSNGRMKAQAEADLKAVQAQYRKYGRLAVSGFDGQLKQLGFKGSERMKTLREKIVADAARMARGVKGSGADMEKHLDTALRNMGIKGDKKARNVRDKVKTAIRQMAEGVGGSSSSAATSLYNALNNMGVNADDILKSLGISKPKYVLRRPPLAPGANGELRPTQRGAYISGGKPSGDSVPILAERGEYVLNREAVKKIGKHNLDRANFRDFPRFQGGGIVELLHPFNDPAGHGGSNSHLHIAASTTARIIQIGKWLQRRGWLVGENPAFGGIQAKHSATGWHPKGLAIDVNWPDAGAEGAKIAAILPLLGGAGGNLPAAIVEKLGKYTIEGPAGSLKSAAQGFTDRVRTAFNKYIERNAPAEVGSEPGASVNVSGNGAGLMRKISEQRGWNFADWWKLDEKESGHGTNLVNPESTARLRGQFLDMNWGKYGPGSDPRQNPSMGQQIYSMASYIQERYGNPTRAWAAWMSHYPPGWYKRGGPVKNYRTGYVKVPPKGKQLPLPVREKKFDKLKPAQQMKVFAKSKKLIDGIHRVKKKTLNSAVSKRVQKRLGKIGFTEEQERLEFLSGDVDKYADWAQRASDITDTDALQAALNAELVRRGATGGMTDAQLLGLFPAGEQDAFIRNWKQQYATFNGGIDEHWLNQELGALFTWRNQMINDLYTGNPTLGMMKTNAVGIWDGLHKTIRSVMKVIARNVKERDRVKTAIENKHQKWRDAKKALAAEEKKDPKSKSAKAKHQKRLTDLKNDVAQYAAEEAALRHGNRDDLFGLGLIRRNDNDPPYKHSLTWYQNRLGQLNRDNNARQSAASTVGGDDGTSPGGRPKPWGGTIGDIESATEAVTDSLNNVHGLGSILTPFTSSSQFAYGTLGGTILSVQRQIRDLTAQAPRATGSELAGPADEAQNASKELLEQLLREANLRTAVSQSQYDVFRDLPLTFGNFPSGGFPFGGFFQEGGTVPGPVGAPRMIVAHGGEYVVPNDGNTGTHVSVHVASGMEWLKQFIDVRVEGQTRTQSRRGERQLPGRAGLLTR